MNKLASIALVLALAACGTGTGGGTASTGGPTTTGTVVTTAPPSTQPPTTEPPTTASTPAPSTTTASPDTTAPAADETITPAGFWEVRVGETLAENEARIGFPLDDLGGDETSCVVLQLPEVGGVYFIAASAEPVASRDELVVGRVSTESPGWPTDQGIEVGMAVTEIEEILGDSIVEREDHAYVEGGEYLIVGPEDARYVFETDGSTVTAIHAGIEPVVSFVEACS